MTKFVDPERHHEPGSNGRGGGLNVLPYAFIRMIADFDLGHVCYSVGHDDQLADEDNWLQTNMAVQYRVRSRYCDSAMLVFMR